MLLYKINFNNLTDELTHVHKFISDKTSVSNPNLAIGLYLENLGNDTNISIKNGSLQFGNYAERLSPDPSARNLIDNLSIASIVSGTDTPVAVYTVPDKIDMYKEINSAGTLVGTFYNTIANLLKAIQAVGTSNKFITLSVYLAPKADVVANYTVLNPYVNILERAIGVNITSVNLTNAVKIGSLININAGQLANVENENHLLTPDLVGVITVSCTQAITDFEMTISTSDLF